MRSVLTLKVSRASLGFTLVGLLACVVSSAEPTRLGFGIKGRSPLEASREPAKGLIQTALFEGEPVLLLVTISNAPPGDAGSLSEHISWEITSEDGVKQTVQVTPATTPGAQDFGIIPPGSGWLRLALQVAGLKPGRYLVRGAWAGTAPGEPRSLVIYRGDETTEVHRVFLRVRAADTLKANTLEAYRVAREMLLEAASDNSNPSVYEELADASAPWAPPDESADFYRRSLEVSRTNLERRYGPRQKWPESAEELYAPAERKVKAFLSIVPYYKLHFVQERVVAVGGLSGGQFVIERRSDGARVRVVEW